MTVKCLLFLLIFANMFVSDLSAALMLFAAAFLLNILRNRELANNLRRTGMFFLAYGFTCILNILFLPEGRVLFTLPFGGRPVTVEGLTRGAGLFLRLSTFIFLSWIVRAEKMFGGGKGKYQRIILTVMELLPEAMTLIRKKMKIRAFMRYILKQTREQFKIHEDSSNPIQD